MDVEKCQRVPLSVYFGIETFFQKNSFHQRVPNSPILGHFEVLLLFFAFDMAPIYSVPGLLIESIGIFLDGIFSISPKAPLRVL